MPLALDWERVFASACELSENHTAKLLTRSVNLLHAAAAPAARCRVFVSADDRQLAVATATGLKVADVKLRISDPRSSLRTIARVDALALETTGKLHGRSQKTSRILMLRNSTRSE